MIADPKKILAPASISAAEKNDIDRLLQAGLGDFSLRELLGVLISSTLGNRILARGQTRVLLQSVVLAGILELLLISLVLRTGRIELVAAAVLVAYVSQAIICLPYLRREFSIGFGDLVGQVWPVIPALIGGYFITQLLPDWLGGTFFTLACRRFLTAFVVALIYGACTRFRCFREAGAMISQNLTRFQA